MFNCLLHTAYALSLQARDHSSTACWSYCTSTGVYSVTSVTLCKLTLPRYALQNTRAKVFGSTTCSTRCRTNRTNLYCRFCTKSTTSICCACTSAISLAYRTEEKTLCAKNLPVFMNAFKFKQVSCGLRFHSVISLPTSEWFFWFETFFFSLQLKKLWKTF